MSCELAMQVLEARRPCGICQVPTYYRYRDTVHRKDIVACSGDHAAKMHVRLFGQTATPKPPAKRAAGGKV